MDIGKTFSELRAILARDPQESDWDLVLRRLEHVDRQPEGVRERFDGAYGHYIRAALERWPADVRALRWDDERERALTLARTFVIAFPPDGSRQREVREAALERLARADHDAIDGVEIHGLREDAPETLARLFALRPALARLDLVLRPVSARAADVPSLVEQVALAAGPHLEHLGLRYAQTFLEDDQHALDVMWESFMAYIGGFARLRSLALGQMRTSRLGAPNWAPVVLRLPEVRRIEDLCVRCVYNDVSVEHMTGGRVWENLRRVKLLGVPDESARRLIAAPELAGVETWAIYDWAPDRRPRGWGGPRTRMWMEWAHEQRTRHE